MGDYIDWMNGNQNNSLAIKLSKLTKVRQIIAKEKLNYVYELIDQALEQCKIIKERYEKFKKSINTEFAHLDKNILDNFISYWTEPNKSNTKMRFELEPIFDNKRRLGRWLKNDFGNNKSNGVKKNHNFEMPDGKNYLAFCDKCLKSDFYESYNFNPDNIESKCCSSKIIDKIERNKRRKAILKGGFHN